PALLAGRELDERAPADAGRQIGAVEQCPQRRHNEADDRELTLVLLGAEAHRRVTSHGGRHGGLRGHGGSGGPTAAPGPGPGLGPGFGLPVAGFWGRARKTAPPPACGGIPGPGGGMPPPQTTSTPPAPPARSASTSCGTRVLCPAAWVETPTTCTSFSIACRA